VKVAGYEAIMGDTQHPESWDRIQVGIKHKMIDGIGANENLGVD
jgi:hypothetical protein